MCVVHLFLLKLACFCILSTEQMGRALKQSVDTFPDAVSTVQSAFLIQVDSDILKGVCVCVLACMHACVRDCVCPFAMLLFFFQSWPHALTQ